GKFLATYGLAGHILVWDVATREMLNQVELIPWGTHCLSFSPDSSYQLASGGPRTPSHDGIKRVEELRVWEPASGREVGRLIDPERGINGFALTSDSRLLYYSIAWDKGAIWCVRFQSVLEEYKNKEGKRTGE